MTKIYGYSDDLVEIEVGNSAFDEIDCFMRDVRIEFYDETVIRIGYPKNRESVWWIEVEKKGSAKQSLEVCINENADIYSDIFYIDSGIKTYSVIEQKHKKENPETKIEKPPFQLNPCKCGATGRKVVLYGEGMAKQYVDTNGVKSKVDFSDFDGWCVHCYECDEETYHFATPEQARDAWNSRMKEGE